MKKKRRGKNAYLKNSLRYQNRRYWINGKTVRALDEMGRKKGKLNEEKVIKPLEALKERGEIIDYRRATKKQDKAGKDWIFTFPMPNNEKGIGWFDVKSSYTGVREHNKKNSQLAKSHTPEIKKTRPALLIKGGDSMENIINKIREIKKHFLELHYCYLNNKMMKCD